MRAVQVGRIRNTICALGVVAASLIGAGAAQAIITNAGGNVVSYTPAPGHAPPAAPFDSLQHNLDYNGGPIMPANTNYTFYWDPVGGPAYPADYQPGLNRFFEDLAHDSGGHENVDSVSTQYNDAAGQHAEYLSSFGGALIDTHPFPASGCGYATTCLTDAQLRAELTAYVTENHLPSDLSHEYFILTPPGVESCLEGSICSAGSHSPAYCAYHGAITLPGGGRIVYSEDPYVAGGICDDHNHPNGTTADATISGGLSHEHNESLTDPEPNNAWTDWPGGPYSGYEIGDKCRTFSAPSEFGTPLGKAPNGASYNQLINGHEYWYQQEWSNQGRTCLQRYTPSGEEPQASFTASTTAHSVSLNAGASTAPGGVYQYEWQFNYPSTGGFPVELTEPTLTEALNPGTYDIALTVFAKDGRSSGTAQSVTLTKTEEEEEIEQREIKERKEREEREQKEREERERKEREEREKEEEEIRTEPAPIVSAVAPKQGSIYGGYEATITGGNLLGATAVDFGKVEAGIYSVSRGSITVLVPSAAKKSSVDVTVTTPKGTSAKTAADKFKYTVGALMVTGLTPSSGSHNGGTVVYVFGEGFAEGFGATSFKPAEIGTAPTVNVIATVGSKHSKKGPGAVFTYTAAEKGEEEPEEKERP